MQLYLLPGNFTRPDKLHCLRLWLSAAIVSASLCAQNAIPVVSAANPVQEGQPSIGATCIIPSPFYVNLNTGAMTSCQHVLSGYGVWTGISGSGSIFASYQFGTQAALTGTGLYLQTTYPAMFTTTQTGSGTSGAPYVDAITLTSQNANQVFAAPNGSAGAPGFRALVGADLPLPTASTIGGIESITEATHNWISYIDTSGVPHQSQPACGDLSNAGTACQSNTSAFQAAAASAVDLGGSSTPFRYLYLYGGGSFGSNAYQFLGTPTAARTFTLPDANSNPIQGIANPSDTEVVNYIDTSGVQHRIAQSGGGTVTVVGSGSLTNTECVTGGGTTTIQTPSANCTVDSSGNQTVNSLHTGGASPTDSGSAVFNGISSGAVGIGAADAAGASILYVLPSTNGLANQALIDTGATTCPTLPAGSPTVCHLLQFVTTVASATTATNVAGGAVGSLPYQSAAATTLFVSGNTAATDEVLVSHGTGSAAQAPTLTNTPALGGANFTGVPLASIINGTQGGLVAGGGSAAAPQVGAAGTAKQLALSGGTGAPTFIDFPERYMIPAANCNNATAGAGWSIGSGGTVTCRAGTNNLGGFVSISDTAGTFAQFMVSIPADWDTSTLPYVGVGFEVASDTTSGHTVIPEVAISCPGAVNGTVSDDHALTGYLALTTVTLGGSAVAHGFYTTSIQLDSTRMSGCVAGGFMIVSIGRATDTATGVTGFYYADVTFPRLLAVQAN
jgi:hypothetical protein